MKTTTTPTSHTAKIEASEESSQPAYSLYHRITDEKGESRGSRTNSAVTPPGKSDDERRPEGAGPTSESPNEAAGYVSDPNIFSRVLFPLFLRYRNTIILRLRGWHSSVGMERAVALLSRAAPGKSSSFSGFMARDKPGISYLLELSFCAFGWPIFRV